MYPQFFKCLLILIIPNYVMAGFNFGSFMSSPFSKHENENFEVNKSPDIPDPSAIPATTKNSLLNTGFTSTVEPENEKLNTKDSSSTTILPTTSIFENTSTEKITTTIEPSSTPEPSTAPPTTPTTTTTTTTITPTTISTTTKYPDEDDEDKTSSTPEPTSSSTSESNKSFRDVSDVTPNSSDLRKPDSSSEHYLDGVEPTEISLQSNETALPNVTSLINDKNLSTTEEPSDKIEDKPSETISRVPHQPRGIEDEPSTTQNSMVVENSTIMENVTMKNNSTTTSTTIKPNANSKQIISSSANKIGSITFLPLLCLILAITQLC